MDTSAHNTNSAVSLATASKTWLRIGLLSFGGPAAQIALMHKLIVEEKAWLKEQQFLNALNFCMLLPGPEAMQLATYSGWRLHGVIGGLIAGLLFVMPGAIVMLALAAVYSEFGQLPLMQALFLGVKAAVVIIVIEALIKISKRALNSGEYYIIAVLAFIAIFALNIPFPMIVLAAAVYGFVLSRSSAEAEILADIQTSVSHFATLRTICTWLFIWFAPILLLRILGAQQILNDIAEFFSKLAVVTFGGAYAVLAYMAQDVVEVNAWLQAEEMVDGLGLAETTPGPLILVTEFVGFLAAEKVGGFWLGVLAAFVTLWVTFAPCFLWIFAGAPYIEKISSHPRLRNALSSITAAVVGVILNLSLWFAFHVFFAETQDLEFGLLTMVIPEWSTIDWRVLVISLVSAILLLKLRLGLFSVLLISAASGVLLSYL